MRLPEDSAQRRNAVAVAGKFVQALSSAPVTEVEMLLVSSQDGHLGLLGHRDTLLETNSKFAPENRQRAPKGNGSYSNHPFSGAFAVSFRECSFFSSLALNH